VDRRHYTYGTRTSGFFVYVCDDGNRPTLREGWHVATESDVVALLEKKLMQIEQSGRGLYSGSYVWDYAQDRQLTIPEFFEQCRV